MNLCKSCVSIFFISSFSFLIKKASKTRKDMQGIHEGTGAMPLSTLLAAVPSCIPVLLYMPQPKFSSMYPLHCHSPSSLCFLLSLSNCLTHRHNRTQSAFKCQREVSSNYRGGFFTWMCLCVFPPLLYALTAMVYFLFFPIVCFLSVYSRLHAWMHNTTIQTNIPFLHPSHYSFAEGFPALLHFLLLNESSIHHKTLPEYCIKHL